LQIVKAILKEQVPDCQAWVFGSRANGRARQFSDLDLMLKSASKLNWRTIERLKDAFSASNLPITVDIVDVNSITEEMLTIIQNGEKIDL
jgi:predicted nucleotidyltransferase